MKTTNLPHLAARIFDTPLLIQQQKLEVILSVLGPRIGLTPGVEVAAMPMDDMDDDDTMGGKPYEITPEGVAIVSIQGTLVKRDSWLNAMSGLSSYEQIRENVASAVADPKIRGILLDIDSPGGEVGGLFDLADYIHSQRQMKPIYAIADDDAFSAGYALASAAEKVYVTRTGGLGSVGVIALHVDQSGFDEKVGLKYTYVSAGARKTDLNPHEPISDAAQSMLQTEIDRLYGMFVETVARNRGMKPNAVRSTEAGLFFGAAGVAAGFADSVGTFQDALDAVTSAADNGNSTGNRMPDNMPGKPPEMPGMRAETLAGELLPATSAVPEAAATAAPISETKETIMEETKQAVAPQPPEPAAQPATLGITEAKLFVDTDEIIALCEMTRHKDLAVDYIKAKLTVAQVREKLQALAVEAAGSEIRTQHSSSMGGSADRLLDAAANSVRNGRPVLTKEQAYVQALNEHPELYQQYLAEHPAQCKSLVQ